MDNKRSRQASRPQQRQQSRTQRPQQSRQSAQARRNPRRRKQKYTLHYLFLFLFCIAVGITICTNVLFKVSSIQVKNCSYYSSEELIMRSGIEKGDKLFRINIRDTEKMLEDRFPYLQSVQVKRRLPSTVVLDVVEEIPMGAVYTEEGYAILSNTGKVLKNKVSEAPQEIPVLLGLEEEHLTVGSYLYGSADRGRRELNEKVQLIQRVVEAAYAQSLEPLTYIEITDISEIKVLYDERILIDFGGEIDMDKKITFVQKVLSDGIANNHPLSGYTNENFEGTIDITDRKQLHTRAIAVDIVADPRAFTVFEEEDAFFAEDEELPQEGEQVEAEADAPADIAVDGETENTAE